jgi:hypothetical protein
VLTHRCDTGRLSRLTTFLRNCVDNKNRGLSILPNVGHRTVNKGKSVPLQARGAQRVPRSYGFHITWQRHRMVVRLSALITGRLYPQQMILVLIFVRGWVDPRAIGRSEGLFQEKIPIISSGIEPATFRFAAQQFNHCTIAVPFNTVSTSYLELKIPPIYVCICLLHH